MRKLILFALVATFTIFVGCQSDDSPEGPVSRSVYNEGEYVRLQFLSEHSSWFEDDNYRPGFLVSVFLTFDSVCYEADGKFSWGGEHALKSSYVDEEKGYSSLYNLMRMFANGTAYGGYNGSLVIDLDDDAMVRTDIFQYTWYRIGDIKYFMPSDREKLWIAVCVYDTTETKGMIAYGGRYTGSDTFHRFGFGTDIAHKPMSSYQKIFYDTLKPRDPNYHY